MTEKNRKYGESMERLEEILESIDRSETGIDELADRVAEASQLLLDCRKILTETEERVSRSLADLENQFDNGTPDDNDGDEL